MVNYDESPRKPAQLRPFKLVKVLHDWNSLVSRYALSELTQGRGVETSENKEVMLAAAAVLGRRKQLLQQLRDAGCPYFASWADYVYAMNCPPVGVVSNQSGLRPCLRTQICPFCWCRCFVIPAFRRFEHLLFHQLAPAAHLLEIHSWHYCERKRYDAAALLDWIGKFKGGFVREELGLSLAACVLCSLEPIDEQHWGLHHRILAVVPSGVRDPRLVATETPAEGIRTRRQLRRQDLADGRRSLAASLGRVASYPLNMMDGPLEGILQITASRQAVGRRQPRMMEFYGALRRLGQLPVPECQTQEEAAHGDRLDVASGADAAGGHPYP